MLKKILIAVIAAVAIFAGVVALQPSEFRVSRTAAVAAPPGAVFSQINDLRQWDNWSPWAKLDPNAKVGFEGAPAGEGAVFTWSGNDQVGEGRMTVVESRPGELVTIKVAFVRPFEGASTSEFRFKPEGSRTAVTWSMGGQHGFIEKAMCLIMNGQKMMGGEMDKGLANLKAVVEAGGRG